MRYHLLVAEHEPMMRQMMVEKLKSMLPESLVAVAENGAQGVSISNQADALDMAFVDLQMPVFDGIQMAKAIWKRWQKCQIVFLTNYSDYKRIIEDGIDLSAADYLLKPFSQTGLRAAVHRMMENLGSMMIDDDSLAIEKPFRAGTVALPPFQRERASENENKRYRVRTAQDDAREKKKIQMYLRSHLTSELNLDQAARDMGYSRTYFSKHFKQLLGENFIPYLTELRILRAKELLLQNPMADIHSISSACGFQNAAYFTAVFRRVTGETPSQFRKCVRGK